MAGGHFRTEIPTMQTATTHVFDVNAGIQTELAGLMARLEPLMATWQGTASMSFHGTKDRWNTNAMKLNEALRGIAECLKVNEQNYSTSEETNTTGFTQIGAVL